MSRLSKIFDTTNDINTQQGFWAFKRLSGLYQNLVKKRAELETKIKTLIKEFKEKNYAKSYVESVFTYVEK